MLKYKTMLSYCLKCKNTKSINPKTVILSNVLYVVLKNQNLLKNKK